ncbi:uncharacterized protein LOC141855141 [Brevipalpus obovatus]|uniref:uncharacterized protein LOC141855141 n=1 Tax=Brevipalpus obovatus TaxID=246614 RepID=UPI003D9DEF46
MSPAKNVITLPTGSSLVSNAISKMDAQWEDHFALLKSMVAELLAFKRSGISKPLTPLKLNHNRKPVIETVCNSNYALKIPSTDFGTRVTRSMAKNKTTDQSDKEDSAKGKKMGKGRAKKDALKKSEDSQDVPAIKVITINDQEVSERVGSKNRKGGNDSLKENDSKILTDNQKKSKFTAKSRVKMLQNDSLELHDPNNLISEDESFKSPQSSFKREPVNDEEPDGRTRKRKPTQYFTPSCPAKSCRRTRAAARAEAELVNSSSKTKGPGAPSVSSLARILKNTIPQSPQSRQPLAKHPSSAPSSTSSITPVGSLKNYPSSKPNGSRTPEGNRCMTNSAIKRKEEDDEKREQQWKILIEKEKKAIIQRKANLEQKQMHSKLKNEEKKKKHEKMKELLERELEEKRIREQEKLADIERKRREKEELKKRELIEHQKKLKQRQLQIDQRKQEEEEDRKTKLRNQELVFKKKQAEIERKKKEENEAFRMIREHNAAIKAPLSKLPSDTQVNGLKNNSVSVKEEKYQPVLNDTYCKEENGLINNEGTPKVSKVFKVPQAVDQESPERTPSSSGRSSPANYDIGDIKSDDGTDDDEAPKKIIPSWAKSENLIKALDVQFSVPLKVRNQQIRQIFPPIEMPIDLGKVFEGSRAVIPRYERRTSSAVWSSPNNMSLNYSRMSEI